MASIEVGKTNAKCSHGINIWCFNSLMAIATEVAVTLIVALTTLAGCAGRTTGLELEGHGVDPLDAPDVAATASPEATQSASP